MIRVKEQKHQYDCYVKEVLGSDQSTSDKHSPGIELVKSRYELADDLENFICKELKFNQEKLEKFREQIFTDFHNEGPTERVRIKMKVETPKSERNNVEMIIPEGKVLSDTCFNVYCDVSHLLIY